MHRRQLAPAALRVLGRVLAVLVGLELLYLLSGNLLLRTQLIQNAVSASEGFHLELGRAHTWWPGRVHVRDFRLRVEDYNVQFELTFASAVVDIRLSELPFKKFHVTKLDAQDTRFRMRHKLITVGDDAERVAAYPPIAGYADPPYYVGVRPPPIPDEKYDLWQVRIENVTAHARELWVMEYRFLGEGVARGSFVVKPARWVQVLPAELTLEQGTLMLGKHPVAERMSGRMTCEVPDMDVQSTEGRGVFRQISSRIELKLSGGKLDFLQAYLARFGALRYAGNAEWFVGVRIARGVVEPGTRVALLASPLVLSHELGSLTGDAMLSLSRADAEGPLTLAFNAPLLRAARADARGPAPRLQGLRASMRLHAANLAEELRLGAGRLELDEAQVPELAWLTSEAATLGGSARAELSLHRSEAGLLSGRAGLTLRNARLARGAFAASSGQVRARLAVAPSSPSSLKLDDVQLEVAELSIRSGDKRTKPLSAALSSSSLRVAPSGAPIAHGPVTAHVSSAEALLPLFVGGVLRDVSSAALDLRAIDARADLALGRDGLSLTRIDARSGRLRLRGHVEQGRQARGALLLSSGALNVGLTLENGTTELSPFVSDDWLAPPRS